jgi:hypothetical protein
MSASAGQPPAHRYTPSGHCRNPPDARVGLGRAGDCAAHDQPVRYRRPESPPVELPLRPQLASWNKAGDPDQLRLTQYLDTVQELLASRIAALPDPLALRLDVGLPDAVHLLDAHDLDNYLYPLAARLTAATGRQFVTVWGTKQHAERSWVRVEQAQPDLAPATFAASALTTTSASSQSTAYKQQLRDELLHLEPLSAGPVRLDLAFLVGARRNWTNLWKPTIDALTPILGPTRPDREWHPRDGRIVELGLHLRAHPDRRTDVTIAVRAQHSATN